MKTFKEFVNEEELSADAEKIDAYLMNSPGSRDREKLIQDTFKKVFGKSADDVYPWPDEDSSDDDKLNAWVKKNSAKVKEFLKQMKGK